MTRSPMAGLAAQRPQTAGMLRIQKGQAECHIWPVHLPGWLALGWRVAGAETPAAGPMAGARATEPAAAVIAAAAEPVEQNDAKPASPRGRRGRRRKDEALPAATAETTASTAGDDSTTASTASNSDTGGPEPSEKEQEAEHPAAAITEPQPQPEPTANTAATADSSPDAEPVLNALPDDLFDDPLL